MGTIKIMNIVCRKTGCVYNDNFVCRAKGIIITKECNCAKYLQKNKKEVDTTQKIYKSPPDYSNYRECKCMNICCNAKCLFNHNKECESNGVTINDIENKPLCISFLRK